MSRENPSAAAKGAEARAAIAAAQRAARRANRGTGAIADWEAADGELVLRLIAQAARANTLISFGYTRDGGAFMVGFYCDGDKYTEYCRPTEDLSEFLKLLTSDFDA